MPQNPLNLLQNFALRNVPKATPQQEENQDFRAQAIQDSEPGWKKVGRSAIDAISGAFEDPMVNTPSVQKGLTKRSAGTAIGMLGAAAPILPKRLPIITPEAYTDVKAGGLRLYSRLTDAFGKAPKVMTPDKIRSVAKQGASAEEIGYRKLEDFLKNRQPMDKVSREDVMGHLAANPIELDVVRKGQQPAGNINEAQTAMDQFQHRMDTQHGAHNWFSLMDENAHQDPSHFADWINEDVQEFQHLRSRLYAAPDMDMDGARYDWIQTPGPKENYSETLINLPVKPAQRSSDVPPAVSAELEHEGIAQSDGHGYESPNVFTSTHWNEPNNLVFSRSSDRWLNPEGYVDRSHYTDYQEPIGGQKGKFVEEIQSDWHQQGRERGYRGRPETYFKVNEVEPTGLEREVHLDNPNTSMSSHTEAEWRVPYNNQGGAVSGYGRTREEGIADAAIFHEKHGNVVPDAPYKDSYHELALKQQLLDAANDPEASWFGIADADTNAAMEGHATVKDGTELWYNQRQPSALEKLLKPFGGKVEFDNLPGREPEHGFIPIRNEKDKNDWQIHADLGSGRGTHVASVVPEVIRPKEFGRYEEALNIADMLGEEKRKLPGPGFWKANLTPEMKEAIKERGFPAMVALMAMQQAGKRMTEGEQ